jgi:Bacterial mobilisation protein (MobC)
LAALRRLTGNLANNINQIARVLNSGGVPDASIPATAEAVRRAMTRLDSVLSGMVPDHAARPQNRMSDSHPGPPRCDGGPLSTDGRTTACAAGANGKGFPRQSGNFRHAVGMVADVANSSLTSTHSMSG